MAARSSRLYNESAYLLCLRGMMQIITRPPCPFENYIIAHFLSNGKEVIEACRYYLSLLEEGEVDHKDTQSGKEKEKEQEKEEKEKRMLPLVPDDENSKQQPPLVLLHRPSKGFCKTLAVIFPRLLKALEDLQAQQPK